MSEAIVLSGGQGTRLHAITKGVPKTIIDVAGRPFIFRVLDKLKSDGFHRIQLALGYGAGQVIKKIEERQDLGDKVEFSIETEPLGTGGAIKLALQNSTQKQCFIFNGDTFVDKNFLVYQDYFSNEELVLFAIRVEDIARYGEIKISKDGYLTSFSEKKGGGSGYINSGVYLMKTSLETQLPSGNFSFERDFLAVTEVPIRVVVVDAPFIDIGVPEDYHRAKHFFAESE